MYRLVVICPMFLKNKVYRENGKTPPKTKIEAVNDENLISEIKEKEFEAEVEEKDTKNGRKLGKLTVETYVSNKNNEKALKIGTEDQNDEGKMTQEDSVFLKFSKKYVTCYNNCIKSCRSLVESAENSDVVDDTIGTDALEELKEVDERTNDRKFLS